MYGHAPFNSGGFDSSLPMGGAPPLTLTPQRRTTIFRPMTCKQLARLAESDSGLVGGETVTLAKIIALLVRIESTTSTRQYLLDDGTGKTNALVYLSSGDKTPTEQLHIEMMQEVRERRYVSVVGRPKRSGGLVIESIRPVTDFNQLTYHLLQCAAGTLDTGANITNTNKPYFAMDVGDAKADDVGSRALERLHLSPHPESKQSCNAEQGGSSSISVSLANRVMMIIGRENQGDDTGCALHRIVQALPEIRPDMLKAAVSELVRQALIYETERPQHYNVTPS